MTGDSYASVRTLIWKTKVPETVLGIYFNHVRAFPAWKRDFPHYLHPSILAVSQLAPDKIEVITTKNRYVFVFEQRETLVTEAAEFVRTGVLEIFCDGISVLRLSASPTDSGSVDSDEAGWTPRCVEEFREGEWIYELTQLAPQLIAFEDEQRRKEQERREQEATRWTQLQSKLQVLSKPMRNRSSLQRLLSR